jgi:amino acid transporter
MAQSVSAVAPAAGVTTVPLLIIAATGGSSLIALATALLLCLGVASAANQFARRIAGAGSLYTFVAQGLGPLWAAVTGVSLVLGYAVIAVFALSGGGIFTTAALSRSVPDLAPAPLLAGLVVVGIAIACFTMLSRGIRLSARTALAMELISLALITSIVVVLISTQPVDWAHLMRMEGNLSLDSFPTAVALGLSAFVGFESATSLAAETSRPFARVPRALMWTVIGTGMLYLLGTFSQVVAFHNSGLDISHSTSPINDLANVFGLSGLGLLLDISIAMSFMACTVASCTALIRMFFSMAREGVLPRVLGVISPDGRGPVAATAVVVGTIMIGALAVSLGGEQNWLVMQKLAVSAVVGFIVAYILVAAGSVALLIRIRELTTAPLVIAGLTLAGLSTLLIFNITAASESFRGVTIASLTAIGILSAGLTLWIRLQKPWVRQSIGVFDETTQQDILGGHGG